MIGNIHSLLNGQWFIHESYGRMLLPSLFAVLDGKDLSASRKDAPFAFEATRSGQMAAAGTSSGMTNPDAYVMVVSMKDPIYKYDQECGPKGTKTKAAYIRMAENDPNCVGLVLDIDSGGGQVSGTAEFHDLLKSFPKPTGSYTDGYMCSAAFYIGSGSDFVMANRRADHIGSIGAMIHFIDVTGIYEARGAKVYTEYATKSTEKNRDFEELIAGNPERYIKNQLDPIVDAFHADMLASRPNLKDETLKGGTWDAQGALEMGLIDEIGTLQDAINKVFRMADAQKSNNQNSNTMSKPRALVQAVLGLSVPLASTEDKGSYLNEEQLDAIEASLAGHEAKATELQGQVDAANTATTEAQTSLTNAQQAHTAETTATATAVDNLVAAAGITATGTTTEKLTALGAHYAAINAKDGGKPTGVKVDNKPAGSLDGVVDANASHNQIANQIF